MSNFKWVFAATFALSGCDLSSVEMDGTTVDAKGRQAAEPQDAWQPWFEAGEVTVGTGPADAAQASTWAVQVNLGPRDVWLEIEAEDQDLQANHDVSFNPADFEWFTRDTATGELTEVALSALGATLGSDTRASICGERILVAVGDGTIDGEPQALVIGITDGPRFAPKPTTVATAPCKLDFVLPWNHPDGGFDQACPATKCTVRLSIGILSQEVGGTCGYGLLGFCECVIISW